VAKTMHDIPRTSAREDLLARYRPESHALGLAPSAPAIQTIGFEPSSVVVTIADPRPSTPHHAVEIIGDCWARILSTVSPGVDKSLR
jgi:hypothetical protein